MNGIEFWEFLGSKSLELAGRETSEHSLPLSFTCGFPATRANHCWEAGFEAIAHTLGIMIPGVVMEGLLEPNRLILYFTNICAYAKL